MEIAITLIICLSLVASVGILVFGLYILKNGGIYAWKKARFEGIMTRKNHAKVVILSPKGRLAANRVDILLEDNVETNEVTASIVAHFEKELFEMFL